MAGRDVRELRQWVQRWQTVGPVLADLRRRQLSATDTQQALLNLADAFESCRLHCPPKPTSGLIDQQRFFARLRS